MELQKEIAQVSSSFDDLLNKWLLFLKIGLQVKDALCTAVCGPRFTLTPRTILCFLHCITSPFFHNPCSRRTCFIPFSWPGNSEWSTGKLISCWAFSPFFIYHPSWSDACLPLGLIFMHDVRSASSAYAEWPCELSTMMSAWYSGPCAFLKAGIILSWSCIF